MFESWVQDANDCAKMIDKELLMFRKEAYKIAREQIDVVEGIDNFTKEKGRHREKERLREIAEFIRYSRLMLARLYFQRKIAGLITISAIIVSMLGFVSGKSLLYCLLPLGLGAVGFVLMIITSTVFGKHFASNMAQAYTHYGICEAVIAILDFRGQESIDLDRAPVFEDYTLGDLL